jgi:hypothetical protein
MGTVRIFSHEDGGFSETLVNIYEITGVKPSKTAFFIATAMRT